MELQKYILKTCKDSKIASSVISYADTNQKNQALKNIIKIFDKEADFLISENQRDLIVSKKKGLSDALIDRLKVDKNTIKSMIQSIKEIIDLPDPIGSIDGMKYLPSGIKLGKMTTPLGVVGIIYESRPNVTSDASSLCIKSGNAVLLRGGSEAIHSNKAILFCIQEGLKQADLDQNIVQLITTTNRDAVGEMLKMSKYIDIIIPRGGKGLIQRINRNSTIPVIKHLDGICHLYVDDNYDKQMALKIADNAKTRRYGVCNALETLLVHQNIATDFLPDIYKIYKAKNVQMRGCKQTLSMLDIKKATNEDWVTEYLAAIISIKIVKNIDEAIWHINKYGSHHTDSIITNSYQKSNDFLRKVDSSSVMVNASTAFADGFEYGLGAEIGISTDKLHVRGPVGLKGLTCQKYIVLGEGQIRS
ncbi:MAG: glutamate-5-semialdehyde dehydrogenase [Gammaproteobacteria bacterium]|nr:MAG: glutamate-5-semialdehyde dehydrogenase [Gammaproteobacteria bacterium]